MLSRKKQIVLIFIACYLPGFRGGGPTRTISNLVDSLSDEFDFKIITGDRDLGDDQPYQTVQIDDWNQVGKASVYYLPNDSSMKNLANIINNTDYDCMYINSFFSPHFSIKPLLLRRLNLIKKSPVILAPRGEFSKAALGIKSFKKNLFIAAARIFKIYQDVFWHASTEFEKADISAGLQNRLGIPEHLDSIYIASNISSSNFDADLKPVNNLILKLCFLSRISAMKNLDYALRVLANVKEKVIFDIYGPKESEEYWAECVALINELPSHITVNYCGSVENQNVRRTLSDYDLLFVPTRGENFGHVFAEALSVGLPILLSDQTPWRNLASYKAGWDISLDNPEKFVEIIESYSKILFENRLEYRCSARDLYRSRCESKEIIQNNIELFQHAFNDVPIRNKNIGSLHLK